MAVEITEEQIRPLLDGLPAGATGHRRFGRAFEDRLVYESRGRGANDRRHPEQPELLKGPASNEQRRGGAARRIDRSVRHRNTDKMYEVSTSPMGIPAKPTGALMSVAPRTVKTRRKVSTISTRKADRRL